MAEFVFGDDYVLEDGKTRAFFDAFLTGLVHKNNNLMGVVQGFGSLILSEPDLSKSLRDSMEQMDSAARTATELNKRVLTAAGFARLDMAPTSLQEMFPFLKDKAETFCRNLDVTCKFNGSAKLPKVSVDNQKFSEIFDELLKNAAEAASETDEKTVVIDFFSPGEATSSGAVDVFIHNASNPIAPHTIKDMYEGFHTTKGSEHLGIGLTIAAILCGQMDVRLGMRFDDGTMSAWMAIPVAK